MNIFLTGSTGYLGVHLVREFLAKSDCELYCLVRAQDEEQANEKLRRSLSKWKISLDEDTLSHVHCVTGDLEKDKLGMSDEVYEEMSVKADIVFHNAAWVNWLLPADLLGKVNADGTKRILEFSDHGRDKKLYFVSSLSVFPFDGVSYTERSSIDSDFALYGGYAQSKWLAEMVVQRAIERGKDAVIMRPNLITGRSDDGVFSTAAFFENCLKSFIQLGIAPDMNSDMAVVPVDYVSKGMAHIVFDENKTERVYHLNNPHSAKMSEIIGWIKDMGYDIKIYPLEKWKKALFASEGFFENGLYQFRPFVYGLKDGYMLMGKSYSKLTDDYLGSAGITCHPIDRELINTYVNYFASSGFLNGVQEVKK